MSLEEAALKRKASLSRLLFVVCDIPCVLPAVNALKQPSAPIHVYVPSVLSGTCCMVKLDTVPWISGAAGR